MDLRVESCYMYLTYVQTMRFQMILFFITQKINVHIVRRKSHIGWNWSTDLFCRLIRVYIGLRQYLSEGVQNFVHWHIFKSNMAAATAKYH